MNAPLPAPETPRTRYRGAQPFGDDALSQRTFFGRESAAQSLTNQVLANRLVVVYAKSGVGKSSLLNAGVAPRLREARCQPLLVRVNDVARGPLASVLEGVRAEAARQQVEYVHGDTGSLWRFFKTVEFWRGDLLLTPVLVIDQFEELFTLHDEAARDAFLVELGQLVRGVRPADAVGDDTRLSDAPPSLHIVLSLREDFLGLLEDAADRIPQILDHRFRLAPLTRENAAEAMVGPARLAEAGFATQAFGLAPEFVDAVLDHLTLRAAGPAAQVRRAVEPFHLQLICQRIEQIVARRGAAARGQPFTLADFGGEAALAETLRSFYALAIASVAEARLRPAARRLCEEFLISPEGRRLSLEEHELRKQLRLSEAALAQLVASRLLRTDRRSDSTYYELSHDALVEPVLATRRVQAMLFSTLAIGVSMLLLAAGGLFGFLAVLLMLWPDAFEGQPIDPFVGIVVLAILGALLLIPWRVLKSSLRTYRRFRRRSRGEADAPMPGYVAWPDRLLGRALSFAGIGITAVVFGIGVLGGLVIVGQLVGAGQLPPWLKEFETPGMPNFYQRPLQEIGWVVFEVVVLTAFGLMLWRLGRARLHPEAEATLGLLRRAARAPGFGWLDRERTRLVASLLGLALALLGFLIVRQCAASSQGQLPGWVPTSWLSIDAVSTCKQVHAGRWKADEVFMMAWLFATLAISLPAPLRALRRAWAGRG